METSIQESSMATFVVVVLMALMIAPTAVSLR
jgi:hypothetical protein